MPEPAQDNRRAAIEALCSAFAFATMTAVAYGLREWIAWPTVAFTRIGVTMLMAWGLLWITGTPILFRGTRFVWLRSIAGSFGILCTFYAVTHMPVTDAITIFAMNPIWVALLMRALFKQAPPPGIWMQIGLAILGVYIMKRPTFDAASFPLAIALLGSVIIAIAKVNLSQCGHLPSYAVVAHYATCATLVTGLVSLFAVDAIVLVDDMNPWQWAWLFPMGLAGTFGQVFMTRAYGRGNPTLVAVVGISQIGMAAIFDLVIFRQSFDTLKIAGIATIAAAIAWSILSTTRRNAREAAELLRKEQAELGDG